MLSWYMIRRGQGCWYRKTSYFSLFDKLEERIDEFMESIEGAKISDQLFNKDQNSALILGIVGLLMQWVHLKLTGKLIFHKKLSKI